MSSDLERVLRDLAELDEGARLEEVLAVPAPDQGVGYGRAAGAPEPSLDEVLRDPRFVPIPADATAGAEALSFRLFRDSRLPSVIELQGLQAPPTAQRGEVHHDEHGVVVCGLRRPSAVVIAEPTGDLLVGVDEDGLRIQRVRRATPDLAALAHWAPRYLTLPTEPPTVDALLDGYTCDGWLPAAARSLAASASPLARVASVGVVARLWSPANTAERDDLLAGRRPDPNGQALAWFGALPEDVQSQVVDLAIAETVTWREDLERLAQAEDEADAEALGRDLLVRRDALESAAFLLGSASAAPLRAELRSLDEEAEVRLSAFVPLPSDPVLTDWMSAAGAWDPLSWWSAAGA
jgi:hypothetical protein